MRTRLFVLALLLAAPSALIPQSPALKAPNPQPPNKGARPMHHATGTFEVKIHPQPLSDVAASTDLGRMSLDKVFHGELDATSKGEMLSILDQGKGSGGYVAIERVTGTLDGKSGGFALQHTGTMNRGVPQLSVTVIPDSGTGDLTGIVGSMKIDIAAGMHSYTLDYTL